MKEAKDSTFLIYDHKLFLPLALRLAKGAKRVLYHTDCEKDFPTVNDAIIGDGYADIERANDIFDVKNEVDCWVFPDIQHSGLQLHLEELGFPVWGSRKGDSLEINRELFHKTLGKIGLEVPEYEVCVGLDELWDYLEDRENVYIKINGFRGTVETFKFRNMDLDEIRLYALGVKLWPAHNKMRFLVFTEIPTDLEIGGDTYSIDGEWPSLMLHGDEKKDRGYIAAVTARDAMPDQIKEIMAAIGPVLKNFRYRNQISFEDRVKDGKHWYIDATQRGGLPSSNSQYAAWENLPEIILAGAHGVMIDPVPSCHFVGECILTMKTEKGCGGKIRIPPKLREWANTSGCYELDGAICFPHDDAHTGDEIGWLTATGDTIPEFIENMKKHADALPDGVEADTDSLVDLLVEVKEGEKQGIDFAEEIPEPETALNI